MRNNKTDNDIHNKNIRTKHHIRSNLFFLKARDGVTEYHIMFFVTDPSLSFGKQLDSLQKAYNAVTKKEAGMTVAVFRRYFLSDAANQADGLMERECENPFCAIIHRTTGTPQRYKNSLMGLAANRDGDRNL